MWFFSILEQMNNLFTKLLQTAWVVEQSLVPISETWHIVLRKERAIRFRNKGRVLPFPYVQRLRNL